MESGKMGIINLDGSEEGETSTWSSPVDQSQSPSILETQTENQAETESAESVLNVNLTDLKTNKDPLFIVTDGINRFSGDFYYAVAMNNVNLIYSPFSMSAAFAMLKIGTKGETSRELQKAFHYPNPDPGDVILARGFQGIFQSLDALKSSPNFTITSANRVYVNDQFAISQSYENSIREHFGGTNGGIVKMDLNKPSAASEINAWVEFITRNKIQNLISPEDLANNPKLVLINAIYFLGRWESEFKSTRKEDFYLGDLPNDKTQVDMMHQDIFVEIADLPQLNAQVLALPYKGGRFVLLISLPKTRNGLSTLKVQNLMGPSQIFQEMRKERVRLSLPKFKIESSLDLTQSLPRLGVHKIFEGGDLSGLSENGNAGLRVSKAIQKAVIIVDEKGTEAAAATAIIIRECEPPRELRVDHPFYYQLVDRQLNLVLFSGAVWHPQ